MAREYRVAIRRFAEETRLDVWYSSLTTSSLMQDLRGAFTDVTRRRIDDVLHHLRGHRRPASAYQRFVTGGENPRIVDDPPHFTHLEGTDETGVSAETILEVVANYDATLATDRQLLLSQFTPVDVARHVVGVGSVGTECFAVLLCGRDHRDTFFLQIKEAHRSVVARARERDATEDTASRVVHGQRVMQVTPDAFLGWGNVDVERSIAQFLRPSALRPPREYRRRAARRHTAGGVRSYVRVDPRARARAFGNLGADRRLHRRQSTFRRGDLRVRPGVSRAKRPRLPGPARCRRPGANQYRGLGACPRSTRIRWSW